ncbi:MAG: hypothetical protein CL661_00750 [Bacteroidetes bacterium]|nr:hypothetical protein [Bacteroidota bacterium]
MKFKLGDKVKFIDEVGGGVVTKILDSRLVNIKTDDGFEMPVVTSELMPDQRDLQTQDTITTSIPSTVQNSDDNEPEFISDINPWGNIKEEPGVYLAFEPHEQQWLLTGDIDVLLVNNTPYELLFSLFLNIGGKIEGVDFNSVPANSKIVIETIDREEIEKWTSGYLQLLFHSDSPDKVYLPVHSVIDIQVSRFFKEGSYRANTLLNGKAIIVMVITQNTLVVASDCETERKLDAEVEKLKTKITDKPLIDKYKTGQLEAVVDLHIGELIDNILGLSSLEMLKIQIDTFKKVLESTIKSNYQKVTFIHGVGNGVLKDAIIKELEDYENLENKMASITKFGVGAIDVVISIKDN